MLPLKALKADLAVLVAVAVAEPDLISIMVLADMAEMAALVELVEQAVA
jgi:hypothetical protein